MRGSAPRTASTSTSAGNWRISGSNWKSPTCSTPRRSWGSTGWPATSWPRRASTTSPRVPLTGRPGRAPVTSPSEDGAVSQEDDGEPLGGQLDLLKVAPLPPCSLCGSKSFRRGCLRCDGRRRLFLRPLPPPRPTGTPPEVLAQRLADARRLERLHSLGRPIRVALIGCGRSKLQRPAPAAELYTGSLFGKAL